MSTSVATKPSHLLEMNISQFMGIELFHLDAKGQHVVITGKNRQGKSSALKAFQWLLDQIPKKDLPDAVRHGANQAKVSAQIGNYYLERSITTDGDEEMIVRVGDKPVDNQKKFLKSLIPEHAFDPFEVASLKPREQIDLLLRLAKVPIPVEKIKEITGEEHEVRLGESPHSYLHRLGGDKVGLYYTLRLEAHRQLIQKSESLDEARERLEQMGGPLAADEKERSVADLSRQMDLLHDRRKKRTEASNLAAESERQVNLSKEALSTLEYQRMTQQREIDELLRRLSAKRQELHTTDECIASRKQEISELEEQLGIDQVAASSLPDPEPEINALAKQAEDIERFNKTIAQRAFAGREVGRLAQEKEHLALKHQGIDAILERIRYVSVHLLDDYKFPIENVDVTVGQESILVNGVPFAQVSTSEAMIIICEIVMARSAGIQIIRIDNAEMLDDETWGTFIAHCTMRGWQVIAARVVNAKFCPVCHADFTKFTKDGLLAKHTHGPEGPVCAGSGKEPMGLFAKVINGKNGRAS